MVSQCFEPERRTFALETVHAAAHDGHAACDCGPLSRLEGASDSKDPHALSNQLPFGCRGRWIEPQVELVPKPIRPEAGLNNVVENLQVVGFLLGGEAAVVLDGVGDATQQIGVADRSS